MGLSREIYIRSETAHEAVSPFHPNLQKLTQINSGKMLGPLTRKLLAISAPAGRAYFNQYPGQPAAKIQDTLTVLSANVWHDWPRRRRLAERLETFAELIETERVDVALLQEVTRGPYLEADEWFARRLGMAHVYSPANGHAGAIGFEEGLAILSRYPLSSPQVKDLGSTSAPITRRIALGITLHTPWGNIPVFTTHLSLFRNRNRVQVARVRDWIQQIAGDRPAIIGGDFNASESSEQIAMAQRTWVDLYRQVHPQGEGLTYGFTCPLNGEIVRGARLDYLFMKPGVPGWSVAEARHLDTHRRGSSDHLAVLARLRPM